MAYLRLGKVVSLCALLLGVTMFTGCGGVSSSYKASPAGFLLPGLGQNTQEQQQNASANLTLQETAVVLSQYKNTQE